MADFLTLHPELILVAAKIVNLKHGGDRTKSPIGDLPGIVNPPQLGQAAAADVLNVSKRAGYCGIIGRAASTSPNTAADLAWCRNLFEERATIREIYRGHPRENAERLAFSDVILEWHLRYGARPDPSRCYGCGDEMAAGAGLVLCDGVRLHVDGVRGINCVTAYGQKWRGANGETAAMPAT